MSTISVSRTIRSPWNISGYVEIARDILGLQHNLSIVLIGDTKARALNLTYRKKNKAANVLTFPIKKNTSEIFLNISGIKREAHQFSFSPSQHAKYLLIHGCLHLKGYTHGSTMEQAEERFLKKFAIR